MVYYDKLGTHYQTIFIELHISKKIICFLSMLKIIIKIFWSFYDNKNINHKRMSYTFSKNTVQYILLSSI